ncbi:MAG: UDP-N-acetylmuramoyl-L-alanyl-D-glutamate--2,6-diaminopimelate ligase [Vicinamibacteraceae bacterium]|nr:UDP-N-acetylmuramoyl-L-alanyl-D-glutamate--2,6-diaminopimelate ligase [Vicinamibacteraceae bacterium]
MTLGELLDRVAARVPLERQGAGWDAAAAAPVHALVYDSRQAAAGSVFFALRGVHADGRAFAPQAVAQGAMAVLAEGAPPGGWSGPWVSAPDARRALAWAAAEFYRHPSESLALIGITGTNGKTTTTYLAQSMLDAAGLRAARLGTISYRVRGVDRDAARTTPEAADLQRLLRDAVDGGDQTCAMEVSSHALALHRVEGLRFAAAVFTNLTRDHLDFHGGMEEYFRAKRRLFEMLPGGAPAIVNIDDPYGLRLKQDFPHAVTYALDRRADVHPDAFSASLDGLAFDVLTPRGRVRVRSRLVGRPNAYNVVAAIAVMTTLDVPIAAMEEGISRLSHVPGRFQTVSGPGDDIEVVVDYAHTDDALRNLLETTRALVKGRIITVFGCGGDRDRTKRPLMGAVAARLSDLVVITSDNPRSETPEDIIEEIKRGIVPPERPATRAGQVIAPVRTVPWLAIVDREAAIRRAVGEALPGDIVVVAGKGHEQYQEIGGRTLPFDDVAVARAALAQRRERRAGDGS